MNYEKFCIIGDYLDIDNEVEIGSFCRIENNVKIGNKTKVWHYTLLRKGCEIGIKCTIGSYVEIGPGTKIGNGTHVGSGSQLHHKAIIGNNVFIAPNVFLSNDKYPFIGKDFTPQSVIIEDDVIICAGAKIVGGIHIGRGAVVGMGAIVTKDVLEGQIVYGCPAEVQCIRQMHLSGTFMEHYGPICSEDVCPICATMSTEQVKKCSE